MIVISAALVVVALVLLVIGLVVPSLGFVYASIAVSLASFAFLIRGILSRRGELPPADGATEPLPVAAVAAEQKAPAAGAAKPAAAPGGTVLVVAGRPRYHVEGCRYLIGKDADSVDVNDARSDGFTACGVCRPDDTLSAAAVTPEPVVGEVVVEETAEVADSSMPETAAVRLVKPPVRAATAKPTTAPKPAPKPAPTPAPTPVAKAAAKAAPAKAAAAKAPAKAAPDKAPAKAAPAKAAAAKAPAKAPAAKAPAKAAPKPAPATKAAAPVKRAGVVVIPDRDKFHTADCRYVRGAEGTETLTRAAATKQGYVACGVCAP